METEFWMVGICINHINSFFDDIASYDHGGGSTNKDLHMKWLDSLSCEVLRLDGSRDLSENAKNIFEKYYTICTFLFKTKIKASSCLTLYCFCTFVFWSRFYNSRSRYRKVYYRIRIVICGCKRSHRYPFEWLYRKRVSEFSKCSGK